MEEKDYLISIAKTFLPNFQLKKFEVNKIGLINLTYFIHGDINGKQASFVLQKINTDIFKEYSNLFQNGIRVCEELQKSGYNYFIPFPLKSNTGKYYHEENKNIWRLTSFLPNSICYEKSSNPQIIEEASKCLGKFYSALHVCDPALYIETIPDFHNGIKKMLHFKNALMVGEQIKIKESAELIDKILEHQNIVVEFEQIKSEIPKRIAHFDAKLSNFLFDKNSLHAKALIDFDTIMPGTVLSDLGDMLRSGTNLLGEDYAGPEKINFDFTIFKHIAGAFIAQTKDVLTKKELLHIPLGGMGLTYIQCIRFLADYLTGNKYYKIKYPTHNLDRAKNQLALFLSMKDNEKNMNDFIRNLLPEESKKNIN